MRKRLLTLSLSAAFALINHPSYAGPPEFMGLGDLPGGASYSEGLGVSADGS